MTRLPGTATIRWVIEAWTDGGRAAATAAELAAIAGAVILLTYAGTIIAATAACGAALFAVRAASLSWRARDRFNRTETKNGAFAELAPAEKRDRNSTQQLRGEHR